MAIPESYRRPAPCVAEPPGPRLLSRRLASVSDLAGHRSYNRAKSLAHDVSPAGPSRTSATARPVRTPPSTRTTASRGSLAARLQASPLTTLSLL